MISALLKQSYFLHSVTALLESVPFMQIQVTAHKRKGKEKIGRSLNTVSEYIFHVSSYF